MHKVSRSLLLAGVLAFGSLTAACGDKVELTQVPPVTGVQSITLTPPAATITAGSSIQLAVSVVADAATVKTVTYTTSAASVATVDATGKVTGVAGGTATIIATSTADPSKAAAAVITVTSIILQNPSIGINSVTDVNGNAVTLGNVNGQINVTVNTSGGGLIEVFLSSACTTNTIGATETAVASQQATSAQPGTVTLSFNTAQVTANAPRFPNGNYCVKARLTNAPSVVVATNTVPLTLNNLNVFNGTLAFASQTGGPNTAVSSTNGLNYNQGTLTVTINPVIFTGASPAVLVSGYLTRKGEQGGVVPPQGNATFTNVPVTAGVATVVFADTLGAPALTSIYQYTSLAAGDTLYIQSATDAAGNPITVGTAAIALSSARGVRIDNDIPDNTATTYIVTAPNGYVGAAYSFASGTGGTAAADTRGTVTGVGGVTTKYWVGLATATGFTNPGTCDVTGLTAAALGSDLANTQVTTADRAKVVVSDALGNKVCKDVNVQTIPGVVATFGVDKSPPLASAVTTNNGASNATGYTTANPKNFSFVYNDSGSAGFSQTQPLSGTLIRNAFSAVVAAATDCQIGTYNATAKTCVATPITILLANTFGVPPNAGGSIQMTNGTAGLVGSSAYYTITVFPVDQAGNVGPTVTRIAAYDTIAPVVGAPTPSPAPVAPLAAVTLSANATDNLDLATMRGDLVYATLPAAALVPGGGIAGPAATSFGTLFDATFVQAASATATLSNVYRGLQNTTAGVVQANAALPFGTLTVTDVGTNSVTSAQSAITTTLAAPSVNMFTSTPVTLTVTPTNTGTTTAQTSTVLTVNLSGSATDIPFQSQIFTQLDVYKLIGGELIKLTTVPVTPTSYTTTTITGGTVRVYTYVLAGIPLDTAAPNKINNLYVVGVNAGGDAVISLVTTVTNP